jgi:hypothetical protein
MRLLAQHARRERSVAVKPNTVTALPVSGESSEKVQHYGLLRR